MVYQNCLALRLSGIEVPFEREKSLAVEYLGKVVGKFRADFICFGTILVELKAQTSLSRSDVAQLANYLAATRQPLGILLNFGATSLEFQRVIGCHALKTYPEDALPSNSNLWASH